MLALSGLLALAAGQAACRSPWSGRRRNLVTGMRVLRLEAASAADLPPGWPSVLRAVHRHSHFV
jgi:hypothetical protein